MLHLEVWIWIIVPQEIQPLLFSPSFPSLHLSVTPSPSVCLSVSSICMNAVLPLLCLCGLSSLKVSVAVRKVVWHRFYLSILQHLKPAEPYFSAIHIYP